jgi:hypothetical protein
MSLLALCNWLQHTPLSAAMSESTWAVPVIAAIHVLGISWFGGTVLISDPHLRRWRFIGLAAMLITGALLFWSQPVRLYGSVFFRVKIVLLLILSVSAKLPRMVSLSLWIAVIFAARGIAYL